MPINGISDLTSTYTTNKSNKMAEDKTSLDMSDFYELMAAQLKYQDMDNPADTSQMLTMMVQSQMIQAITTMANTNTTTYAASLVGKEVTVAEVDATTGEYKGDKSGIVTGVILGDDPLVLVDGKSYKLSQVMAVGEVPEEDEKKPEGAGDNGDNENNNEDPDDTTV